MGKFFGLVAVLGTVVMVSGCVKGPAKKSVGSDSSQTTAEAEQNMLENDEPVSDAKKEVKDRLTCRKSEDSQKISEEVLANAIAGELSVDIQDTNVVNANCEGKDVLNEKRVFEGAAQVIITGPQAIGEFSSVEIESARNCAKVETSQIVADVVQSAVAGTVVEADGDLRLLLTNSVKRLEAMPVVEGKNLVKVKYLKCIETADVTNADGSITKSCAKTEVVAEKEVLLNVAVKPNVLEGTRTEQGCNKPKTVVQE